jgi:cytochrome c biogenesis protein CcmG/thiol:disulfide interchange protein DsbE
VVNVFASWCAPCRLEAVQLTTLSKLPGIAVYGLAQKDKPAATRAFLDEVGNPFARIARDDDGRASIEWGVYGVPETYVVDGKGIIRLKYVGQLTEEVLAQQVVPAIKAAQANP